MVNEEERRLIGEKVREIAPHYYAGLTRRSLEDAEKAFKSRAQWPDLLINSALRLAEKEVMSASS